MNGRHAIRGVLELVGGPHTILLAIATLVAILVFAASNPLFWSPATIRSILLSSSWFAILAVGTTFALATRAVDFSIMANTALAGIVAASVSGSLSPVIGVPAAILAA